MGNLCSLCPGRTVFHADRSTQEKEYGKRKRSLDCARDDDTRMPLPSCDFQSSAMPISAPSDRLRPKEGGGIPLRTHSSFRAKARNLFRSRSKKDVRGAGNGKPSAPCAPKKRCFMQTAPRRKKNTANEKDPSAALGMTIRECRFPQRRCEITIISFSRSICLGGLAALIGVTGKPYPRYLSYHSHPIRPCGAPSPRGEGLRYENTIF